MVAALLMMAVALPQAEADTAVVCPVEFREALGPWLEYRTEQGHTFAMLTSTDTPDEIRRAIREVARGGRLRFVVLVGDAEPGLRDDPALRARCVPVHHAKAEVNVLWGSEPHIATDDWYADLDDDGMADVAIGRLTPDTPAELRQMVAKILAYERSTDFGPWRRRLNFVAGVGGFGMLADMVLESSARYLLTQGIPADYQVSMTYGSWRSVFCPDPRLFHQTTLQRLNEGSWMWVYIGHGYPLGLDRVRMPDTDYHILATPDMAKVRCRAGPPIALFLACYLGAVDCRPDCLAEELLRRPDGPVAAIAGSRVTMPYAMTLLATGLMDQCFRHRCATLGEALLGAKQALVDSPPAADTRRATIDAIAAAVSPAPKKLAAERAEHTRLFNLLGDPMLRLRYPQVIELDVAAEVPAGRPLQIKGTCPVAGRATIELVVRRDRLAAAAPSRGEYPQTSGELAAFQEVYQRANDRRLGWVELAVENGPFVAKLDVPGTASGACHVRVFVEGRDDFAMGAADLVIRND